MKLEMTGIPCRHYIMNFLDLTYISIRMSDIFTSYSSCVYDDRIDNDNLVEFLTKLARFGIDQCLHFVHLIVDKQRLLQSYQDYRVINHFSSL